MNYSCVANCLLLRLAAHPCMLCWSPLQDIAHLATMSDLGDIKNAAIVVKGNSIAWVGPAVQLPPDFAAGAARVESLADCVVIPGLVNTHHHMYQTLTRCVAQVQL